MTVIGKFQCTSLRNPPNFRIKRRDFVWCPSSMSCHNGWATNSSCSHWAVGVAVIQWRCKMTGSSHLLWNLVEDATKQEMSSFVLILDSYTVTVFLHYISRYLVSVKNVVTVQLPTRCLVDRFLHRPLMKINVQSKIPNQRVAFVTMRKFTCCSTDASRDTRGSRTLDTQLPRVIADTCYPPCCSNGWAELWSEPMKLLVDKLSQVPTD